MLALYQKAKSKNREFTCPTCSSIQKEIQNEDDVRNLIKNFNLLRIVEKIEKRMSSKISITKNAEENNLKISNPFLESKNIKEYSDLNTEQKCKKHNVDAFFHAIGTNMMLCGFCVKETNLKAYPLPGVIREFKRKCDSTMIKINLLKTEIDRLQEFFTSYE